MKNALCWLLLLFFTGTAWTQVRVRGHFRRDGTYVQPHHRSGPDGSFYNNWSTKGNVNPYTGASGTKVTPPSAARLRMYYEELPSGIASRSGNSGQGVFPRGHGEWSMPTAMYELPELPGDIAPEDAQRSTSYCARLYEKDLAGRRRCDERQRRALLTLVIPDYGGIPEDELRRGASYCEDLYGDDRAGFYNRQNRQIFHLTAGTADFSSVPQSEAARGQQYCEQLYGNDRGGFSNCIHRQASTLRGSLALQVEDLNQGEWSRSTRYCERLYGNDRGGAATCRRRQANNLRMHQRRGSFTMPIATRSRQYCESLYGDDRSGYWSCISRQ